MDYEALLNLALEVGYRLQVSGAEIYRVEQSVQRILEAYGADTGEVFAIPNCLIVSVAAPDGHPLTRIRRIQSRDTDIYTLEAVNGLCRRLCRDTPPLDEALGELRDLERAHRSYTRPALLFFPYFVGAGAFCLFFGGTLRDCLVSALCGLATGLCLWFMDRLYTNLFFKTVAGGLVSGLLAMCLTALGLGENTDLIIIGALMTLVPGLAFTNAVRDILNGDLVSGIAKIAESLLIGAAIALGTGIALGLMRLLPQVGMDLFFSPHVPAPPQGDVWAVLWSYAGPCLWAFVASLGFSVLYNIQGSGILICGLGGALGWLVYLLAGNLGLGDIVQAFLAASALSAYAEGMARLRRCPVTGYLLVGCLPLVPGGGIYYTMEYALSGDNAQFLSTGLHTLGIAGALAVGVLLVSSLVKLVRVSAQPPGAV